MTRWRIILCFLACAAGQALQPARVSAQSPTLQWDEDPNSTVTSFSVSVDGVRTNYGLTPRASDGSCGCKIPLPFTTGRHTLIVYATNTLGESASQSLVNGPTARAGGPYSAQVGVAQTFSGSASTASGGTLTNFAWNWGDGSAVTQSASSSATHTYATAATFTVALTVTDSFAVTSVSTATVTVSGGAVAPTAPSAPTPVSGATAVSTSTTLRWSATGATSYDVQFGTANPPPTVSTGQATASFTPATLTAGTTYAWRIVARNSAGTATGPIWTFTTASATSTAGDIVIYANDVQASQLHGFWTKASDGSAAAGVKIISPDGQRAVVNSPLAAPADYVDVVFNAAAGTPYALWMRLLALNNDKFNDSLWVQFSDAQAGGGNVFPLNSTTGLLLNLATDASATSLSRWGWQNGAYWLTQPTTLTFAASGAHTLRIQTREDGVQFDQIVLSPTTFRTQSPGSPTSDSTIVPQAAPPPPPPPPPPPSPGQNLLVQGGFEGYATPSLGVPGWISDQPLRQIAAKSESNQPRSGSKNGACWATTNADCGMYQEVVASVTGTYDLVMYATADRTGGWIGANVNGRSAASNPVSAAGFGNYVQYTMQFQAAAGETIRVWMYSPASPGYLVMDDVSLILR